MAVWYADEAEEQDCSHASAQETSIDGVWACLNCKEIMKREKFPKDAKVCAKQIWLPDSPTNTATGNQAAIYPRGPRWWR